MAILADNYQYKQEKQHCMAAYYTFEDLSGGSSNATKSDNPYHDLIESCQNDPTQIQARYNAHRTNRNAQQKEKLLSPDFPGVTIDSILAKLESPSFHPNYQDPRHCLVFWARPTPAIKNLIKEIQTRLETVLPNLWIMPQECLHMTALEITHSRTEEEIENLVEKMEPVVEGICNWTVRYRARLVKPMVSFDAQALALSWLPAAGEARSKQGGEGDGYTYHHLRRDLFRLAEGMGVQVESRYVIPSAHLTIGRFITREGLESVNGEVDREKVRELVEVIGGINEWLEETYWSKDGSMLEGGEWVVGEGKGLDFRKGRLWYGGGETVKLGEGF